MNPIEALRRLFANVERSRQMLAEIREGVANLTDVTNRHLITLAEIMGATTNEAKRSGVRHIPALWASSMNSEERFIKPLAPIVDYQSYGSELTHESIILWRHSADFQKIKAVFLDYPKNSLVGGIARELLYHVVRVTKAQNVVEIGTYFAATSEVIARALWENGHGTLHTTDPFGAERCSAIILQWPYELRRHIQYYAFNSMEFFSKLESDGISIDVAFIDGNHDFEFAYFDLCAAAKLMRPGGIVLIDNIEQSGPFWAAVEFLRINPNWIELGDSIANFDASKPFDEARDFIDGTPFIILRAPTTYLVQAAPRSTGQKPYTKATLSALRLVMASPAPKGILHAQIFLRTFSFGRDPEQLVAFTGSNLDGQLSIDLPLKAPLQATTPTRCTAEVTLFWQPQEYGKPLLLTEPPIPHDDGGDNQTESPGAMLDLSLETTNGRC